jgi:predicted nucleic acid-binding protein
MIVLDTNVISELFEGRQAQSVYDWLDRQDSDALFLTSILIAELVYGAELLPDGKRKQGFAAKIDAIVDDFEGRRLGFGDEAAYLYGAISAKRRKLGRPIETKDAMIAAICLLHGATLATTRNVRDFEGLDFPLINPFEGP